MSFSRLLLALAAATIAFPALGLAQDRAPKPKKVKKDIFEVQCRFGAADSSIAPFGLRYGMDPVDASMRVRKALKEAGIKVAKDGILMWTTSPIDRWPTDPRGDPWRAYAHPGVFATVLIAKKADTVIVIGSTKALCASSPGAPDSTIAAAVQIVAEDLVAALVRGSPMPTQATVPEVPLPPNGRLELDGRWRPGQPCTAVAREGAVEVVC